MACAWYICAINVRAAHKYRVMEQLEAREVHSLEVAGSSPAYATNLGWIGLSRMDETQVN